MQIVIDYVSGRITADVFKEAWYANDEIKTWIDNLIDLKSEPKPEWASLPFHEFRMAIHKHYGGSPVRFIEASEAFALVHPNRPRWLNIGWYFDAIASVVVVAYPDVKPTSFYNDEETFYLASIGSYIGGSEVEAAIFDLLSQFPYTMSKNRRQSEAKKAIKKLFHVAGFVYPRWVQEPEWPMGKTSPMKFVSQKRVGECVQFLFRDVDTGDTRIVEQLY